MKRANLFLFSALVCTTAVGFVACGSKDSASRGPVRPTLVAKVDPAAGGKDAQGNEIKDQTGAVSISGAGVFAPNTADGLMDIDSNLVVDDKSPKTIQTLSKESENDIKTASGLRTYINLGCVGADGKKAVPVEMVDQVKDMKEVTVQESKDVTVYSAYAIMMCGKVKLPLHLKMSARLIYLLNAYPSAELKPGKWIITAESIYSRGTENTLSLPIKTDGDTALDLSVSKEIVGTKTREGATRSGGGVLQLHTAKKPVTRRSKPSAPNRLGGSELDVSADTDLGADAAPAAASKNLSHENANEEDNGQTNQDNI